MYMYMYTCMYIHVHVHVQSHNVICTGKEGRVCPARQQRETDEDYDEQVVFFQGDIDYMQCP